MKTGAMSAATAALMLLAGAIPSRAAMVEQKIAYTLGHTKFEGLLVYDDSIRARRPAVLMAPNFMGVTRNAAVKARLLAGTRYVIFVADMYGAGVRPKNGKEAGQMAGVLRKDIPLMRARINKALDVLLEEGSKRGLIDATRIGAIGFCFGGGNVLELARSGRDVKGVVSFHGDLLARGPKADAGVKAKILVLHGQADPVVPKADRDAFEAEMAAVKSIDWQMVVFSGAVHSFTNPDAKAVGRSHYDARTAKRSFEMMHDFFAELF